MCPVSVGVGKLGTYPMHTPVLQRQQNAYLDSISATAPELRGPRGTQFMLASFAAIYRRLLRVVGREEASGQKGGISEGGACGFHEGAPYLTIII